MKTLHRHGYLVGESTCGKDVAALTAGGYDLILISPSWDRRCLSLVQAKDLNAKFGIVLLYEVRDSQGFRDAHDKTLLKYIGSRTEEVREVFGRSVDIDELWPRLLAEIRDVWSRIGRPLRIFIDLSTFSRFYAMAILAACLSEGSASNITIFYSEGLYRKAANDSEEIAFSRGRWRTVTVPFLEGICDPGKQKYYLVSVGFEGTKTLQVVSREDPDRISILFPNPGYLPEYVGRTEEANQVLKERFQVPRDQIINVRAGDAVETWKRLDEAEVERPEKENTFYLSCGTKPHAVGLALRALCVGHPAVLYRVPIEHRVVDIAPNGIYWTYNITDLSALTYD